MRLRLRIERNDIPAVEILWPIDKVKQTISQFLAHVNERIPLEVQSWGLEDYAVAVGGYEALHYSQIYSVFKDEDEVVIRALSFVDHRARTLAGRDQISTDGRHLLDGVPFGKPLLKRPRRPDVNIPPPSKRLRFEAGQASTSTADGVPSSNPQHGEVDYDSEEDDGDFEMNGVLSSESEEESDSSNDQNEDELVLEDDADSSSLSVSTNSSDAASSILTSESESDLDESSSDKSWLGIHDSEQTTDNTMAEPDSKKERGSVDAAVAIVDVLSPPVPPGAGKLETRRRNDRRKHQKKLSYAKKNGLVPQDATLEHLKALESGTTPMSKSVLASEQQRLQALIASGGIDVTNDDGDYPNGEAQTVQKLPSQVYTSALPSEEHLKHHRDDFANEDSPPEVEAIVKDTQPSPVDQRVRLDVDSMRRLVFGSLGVRNPKTQAAKDALQHTLGSRRNLKLPHQKVGHEGEHDPKEDEINIDPEAWREKLLVTAVECCDEGVTLSAPPFPFKQYWDPQYSRKKRKRSSDVRGAKNCKPSEQHYESYDKYNPNGDDTLVYDEDESYLEDPASYWEDNEADTGDSPAANDVAAVVDDGFPTLPADLSTLITVTEADVQPGDYITFTELTCSATTNWQPQMLSRTARLEVLSRDKGECVIKPATRDLQPKEFDEDGNRIYQKFEMEGMSDDEEDEAVRTLLWADMGEVKLVQRGG